MSDVKMESKTYRKDFLEYEYQARSDVGQVRTNNEDSLIEAPDLGFFGVCVYPSLRISAQVPLAVLVGCLMADPQYLANLPKRFSFPPHPYHYPSYL